MRAAIAALAALAVAGLSGPAALADGVPPTVTVVGQTAVESPEGTALQAELDAYGARRNVEIVYEQYSGPDELRDRITGPNPPDVALVAQPRTLADLAPDLVDVSNYMRPRKLRRQYGDHLIDLATVDGAIVGVPVQAALKSIVWYQPDHFAAKGYSIPQSFTELIALSDQMVADNETPWCNYIESGAATGWMGTDWVEDLLLTTEGPAVYDAWVDHTVPFVDPRVESAFERYQQMIDTPGFVFDRANMLSISFFENAIPLGDGDCLMHKQASFFVSAITSLGYDLGDFSTFEFPPVDLEFGDAAVGGAEYVAAVTDGKQVRQLVRFMASPRFGKAAIAESETGWILPNRRFEIRRYGDELTRMHASTVRAAVAADQFRYDASDLMPPEVGAGTFWTGIADIVAGAKTIPQVLADIDSSWPT